MLLLAACSRGEEEAAVDRSLNGGDVEGHWCSTACSNDSRFIIRTKGSDTR